MVTRPSTVTAPPAYRPPGAYYEERSGRRSVWPWLLGLLACAVIAGGGFLIYNKIQNQFNKNGNAAVIDVRSEMRNLAVINLKNAGFNVKVETRASDTIPKGEVVDQNPGPGIRIGKGSTVTIFVSTGKQTVQVPDVRGKTLSDAIAALNDVHLNADPHDVFSATAPAQTIVGQAPAGGEHVFTNTKVRLNVSQGPHMISIPNVVGSPFANAESALKGAGFVVVRKDAPADQPKGEVVTTDPQVGSSVAKGSTVTVTVSKGPGTSQVPDVTGLQQNDGAKTLQAAGFAVTIVMTPVSDPSQDGIVLAENPAGGTKAKAGTVVTITVGQLAAPTTTDTTTTPTTTSTSTSTSTSTTTTTTQATTTTP
jgi:serine/threonine-protein kinase